MKVTLIVQDEYLPTEHGNFLRIEHIDYDDAMDIIRTLAPYGKVVMIRGE